MGLRQCDNCSEMVDEAKAFCPGCGNAFVEEEKRKEETKFEKLDSTVQFGQTMYNQMLSDMGLNISQAPNRGEKRVEMITSIKTEVLETAKPADPVKPETVEVVKAADPIMPAVVETAKAADPIKPTAVKPEIKAEIKAPVIEPVKPPEKASEKAVPAASSNTMWYIFGGVAVVLLLPIALASTILLVLDVWARISR